MFRSPKHMSMVYRNIFVCFNIYTCPHICICTVNVSVCMHVTRVCMPLIYQLLNYQIMLSLFKLELNKMTKTTVIFLHVL